ncbi:MAG: hypothetical protein YHS30scaffold667_23 [Phage 65_10]|nr:MAG: hypothetical protein YHS30scaffold667_23 [Phage 65_10]
MKNFQQAGDEISLLAPYDVASGAGFLVGSLFAVATSAALSGAAVEGATEGVFVLATLSTDTTTVGAKAYWDNTNKRCTTTSSGNTLIGVFTAIKASGPAVGTVYVDGTIR